MSVEFVDTNVLIYAHDGGAGSKHKRSIELLSNLFEDQAGALSIQVLAEFYAAATRKLKMTSQQAEEVIADLASWTIHRPLHADLIRAAHLQRRHHIAWWDALIVTSAIQLGCAVLWTEDLSSGQRYGTLTVRNPFA